VKQHCEPGAALDERSDRSPVCAEDEVALPVARYGSVLGLCGTLADHDLLGDEALAFPADAGSGYPERPATAQTSGELAPQHAAALHVERLVDRLVRDSHRLIMREIQAQPVGDLLRAPRRCPPAILAMRLVATLPRRRRGP